MDQRANLDHNYVNVTAVHLHSAAYLHVDSHILVALGEDDLEREGWGGEAMRGRNCDERDTGGTVGKEIG